MNAIHMSQTLALQGQNPLDAARRARIRDLVFDHARRRGLPVLMVTHDAGDAAAAGGDVIVLAGDAPDP